MYNSHSSGPLEREGDRLVRGEGEGEREGGEE